VQRSAGVGETGLWLPRNQRREFTALERAARDQLQVRSQIENRILQYIARSYLDRRSGGSSKIFELTISQAGLSFRNLHGRADIATALAHGKARCSGWKAEEKEG